MSGHKNVPVSQPGFGALLVAYIKQGPYASVLLEKEGRKASVHSP